jgi:hypothetical protein
MWFSAVRAELRTAPDAPDAAAVDEACVRQIFEMYKTENPTLSITENKRNLIVAVMCRVP